MNPQEAQRLSLKITGITATAIGVAMILLAGASVETWWLGMGVLMLGFLLVAAGLFARESRPSAMARQWRPPVTPGTTLHASPGGSAVGAATGNTLPTGTVKPAKPVGDAAESGLNVLELGGTGREVGDLAKRFNQWLGELDDQEDAWAAFDRWLRDTLQQVLGARRVRCFRLGDGSDQLRSLSSSVEDQMWAGMPRAGLIDHVLASGRRYLKGMPGNGELVDRLAFEWAASRSSGTAAAAHLGPPDWLVPVIHKGRPTGLIAAGELPGPLLKDAITLAAVGDLLEVFWHEIEQHEALAVARRTDRASGVLNRIDLASTAERAVHEAAMEGEPVVVLALGVEGVRRLDDEGHWRERDWLLREIGVAMRRKLRSDDLIGRFSDDRFVGVLRRLDLPLGQLIAQKLLEAVNERLSRQTEHPLEVKLRCGLAAAGKDGFEAALVQAFDALQRARTTDREIVVHERAAATGGRQLAEVAR